MEVMVVRQGSLDVHKEQVTACVRVPGPDGGRVQEIRQFKTTTGGLLVLSDWFSAHQVTDVVMEATGDYWKPVWHVLEGAFKLMLVNARDVKNLPGRKTDVKDAEWLCQLAEAGLLRASFVPPKPVRDLRLMTRYRHTQIAERRREAQRLHKALEETGIKLDTVATDILGKSGRLMLDALISGTRDPEILAELAKGRMRTKIPQLREALQGHFEPLHAVLIGQILSHLDFLDRQIAEISATIEEQMRPFSMAAVLLCTIPGVQKRTAEILIAEIGDDMSVFPTAGHLASWAGQCPGNDQSAGKRRSGRTRKGSKHLNAALTDAAMAALRTNDSYLQALYRRKKPQLGHGRALGAVKHSMLCAVWHMLSTGELYNDLGGDYFARRDPARQTRRLVARLEQLGHTVTLTDTPVAA